MINIFRIQTPNHSTTLLGYSCQCSFSSVPAASSPGGARSIPKTHRSQRTATGALTISSQALLQRLIGSGISLA